MYTYDSIITYYIDDIIPLIYYNISLQLELTNSHTHDNTMSGEYILATRENDMMLK